MTGKPRKAAPKKAKRKRGGKLTAKQQKFARAYAETGNASEAYRRAYDASRMKSETITRTAFDLLQNPNVAAMVEQLQNKAQKVAEDRYEVTQERIIAELARIAFARSEDYFTWGPEGVQVKDSSTLTRDQLAAVAEVSQTISATGGTIKVKLSDKQGALEKLGRTFGMFKERIEQTGKDGGPIQHDLSPTIENTNLKDLTLNDLASLYHEAVGKASGAK